MKASTARLGTVGLVVTGQITKSFLTRAPGLADALGPVKSSSLRTASRLVNVLRAGYPSDSLAAFAGCQVILLYLPAESVAPVVSELVAEPVRWKNRSVLLSAKSLDSTKLQRLEKLGAGAGTISPIPGFEDSLFVVEGNRLAVKHARWLLERDGTRVYGINRSGRPLYCAGLDFTTSLFKPLVAATMETLENAGMSQHQAAAIAEQLFQRSLRQFLKAGKRGWEGPLASGETDVIEERVRALYDVSPALADYYCDQAVEALRFFSRDSAWMAELRQSLEPAKVT
jgi:predicted short-subunit dehydrogenase-like oxidoreductase (DUF2520 family)